MELLKRMDYSSTKHKKELSDNSKFLILAAYAFSLILFGFWSSSPQEIALGLQKIITSPDTLITDYIGVGGLGATLVNSGTLTLIIIFIFYRLKIAPTGFMVACLFTVAGCAFFGKNLFNVWFVVAGVFLYGKYHHKPFKDLAYAAFFGTALAPVVTEIIFSTDSVPWVKVPLGIGISLAIGFILPPVSANLLKVHQGFSLYNMGFTAGIVGTIVVSLLNSYGIVPVPQMIWTKGNNLLLGSYLGLMFLSMLMVGIYLTSNPLEKIRRIWASSGQLVTDFVIIEGFGASLINMGINGLIATFYILVVKGDLNGPTVGGILTIVGFSAFGKHPKNIIPIFLGVYLGTFGKHWNANDPSLQLAALFGTTLAPIAGKYGWSWGIIAGFIHSSAAQSVGVLHGGLNLYNNGFAAGIVATTLVPVIQSFEKIRQNKA
jgi:hypothetical protein